MKKVLCVATLPLAKDGITSVIFNIYRNLDTDKVSMDFVVPAAPDKVYREEIMANGNKIYVITRSLKNIIQYVSKLTKVAKEYDAIHVHGNSATMWFEIYAAKKANVPVRIAHAHNSYCLSRTVHRLLRPLLIRDMTLGIGCSDLARKFAFNNKKSILLNNGIDTKKFTFNPDVREVYRKKFDVEDKYVIGHVGYLSEVKNQIFLCKVAKELLDSGETDFCMFFIGEGTQRDEIENYIGKNKLSDYIKLLGLRDDINALYQMMDLFVMPSLFEGYPMVLVEAQTSGLDCLISDRVTKTTNLLGRASYLPIEGDECLRLWSNQILSKKLEQPDRSMAKKVVEEAGFSIRKSVKKLIRVYSKER